jgi:hypothetical protein
MLNNTYLIVVHVAFLRSLDFLEHHLFAFITLRVKGLGSAVLGDDANAVSLGDVSDEIGFPLACSVAILAFERTLWNELFV